MVDLYAIRTNHVKPDCTYGALYGDNQTVHDAYMIAKTAKKVVPRFKKPAFRPTFIKQWREKRELTQQELAARVADYLLERGVGKGRYSHASIGRIENGKMGYTQLVLEAIADALRTDPASLLMRNPHDGAAMWSIWDQALPAERQIIEEQAEVVIRNRRHSA